MTAQMRLVGRLFVVCVVAAALIAVWSPRPSAAQAIKNRIIDAAANSLISQIQSESCGDFAASLRKMKGGSGGSSSQANKMLKNDPAARERFINKVAGPLLNKMIDCDLLPSQ